MKKQYDKIAFEKLARVIRAEDKESEKWLDENDCRELREFWDACEGVEKSFKWLLENGHRPLAAVVDAMNGNDQAKVFLLSSGNRDLAALVEASDGSQKAVKFLLQTHNPGWIIVAKEIFQKRKKSEKSIWSIFNLGNPFR
jgi:hypothetical protein